MKYTATHVTKKAPIKSVSTVVFLGESVRLREPKKKLTTLRTTPGRATAPSPFVEAAVAALLAARFLCTRAIASSMMRCTATGSGEGSDGDCDAACPDGRAEARGDAEAEAERDRDLEADWRRGGITCKCSGEEEEKKKRG